MKDWSVLCGERSDWMVYKHYLMIHTHKLGLHVSYVVIIYTKSRIEVHLNMADKYLGTLSKLDHKRIIVENEFYD